ncbi:hypothetical protein ACLKA6_000541 [Drosophila palustris]
MRHSATEAGLWTMDYGKLMNPATAAGADILRISSYHGQECVRARLGVLNELQSMAPVDKRRKATATATDCACNMRLTANMHR